jgi:hypothetical protein
MATQVVALEHETVRSWPVPLGTVVVAHVAPPS